MMNSQLAAIKENLILWCKNEMTLANEEQTLLVAELRRQRDTARQQAEELAGQLAELADRLAAMATNYATLAPLIETKKRVLRELETAKEEILTMKESHRTEVESLKQEHETSLREAEAKRSEAETEHQTKLLELERRQAQLELERSEELDAVSKNLEISRDGFTKETEALKKELELQGQRLIESTASYAKKLSASREHFEGQLAVKDRLLQQLQDQQALQQSLRDREVQQLKDQLQQAKRDAHKANQYDPRACNNHHTAGANSENYGANVLTMSDESNELPSLPHEVTGGFSSFIVTSSPKNCSNVEAVGQVEEDRTLPDIPMESRIADADEELYTFVDEDSRAVEEDVHACTAETGDVHQYNNKNQDDMQEDDPDATLYFDSEFETGELNRQQNRISSTFQSIRNMLGGDSTSLANTEQAASNSLLRARSIVQNLSQANDGKRRRIEMNGDNEDFAEINSNKTIEPTSTAKNLLHGAKNGSKDTVATIAPFITSEVGGDNQLQPEEKMVWLPHNRTQPAVRKLASEAIDFEFNGF